MVPETDSIANIGWAKLYEIATAHLINQLSSYQGTTLVVPKDVCETSGL